MKVVHISSTDTGGGAAIACARLCEAMIKSGLDSTMLVLNKNSNKQFVKRHFIGGRFILQKFFNVSHLKAVNKLNPIGTFSVMKYGHSFSKDQYVQSADVIFIHWVNNNTMSISDIEEILSLGKPTFFFMHDMFYITGGCHHALDCLEYTHLCENCPLIQTSSEKKTAKKQLALKLKKWSKYQNLSFITPSEWLASCVRKSSLASGHQVFVVPNVLNTDIYKPINFDVKSIFGLDPSKKTILFGAAAMNSVYKGAVFAHDCLKKLDPSIYEGLVIGNANADFIADLKINVVCTGSLSDDLSLSLAYNACDTFIISSMAENYPNVVAEAMACGKPCVGFPTGGIPDLIKHMETGYLTTEKTADDLLNGIEWLFEDDNRYKNLSVSAREQIILNNSYQKVLTIHSELKDFKLI